MSEVDRPCIIQARQGEAFRLNQRRWLNKAHILRFRNNHRPHLRVLAKERLMDLWFTLLAVVLTVSALVAGLVIRGPLSFPMLFLSLGLILGPGALGVVNL